MTEINTPRKGRKPWVGHRYSFNTTDDRVRKVDEMVEALRSRDTRATQTDVLNAAIDALHERLCPLTS